MGFKSIAVPHDLLVLFHFFVISIGRAVSSYYPVNKSGLGRAFAA